MNGYTIVDLIVDRTLGYGSKRLDRIELYGVSLVEVWLMAVLYG